MPYTIIIPIHNEEANIPNLLEGLKPFTSIHEILVVDDGSTDDSYTLLSHCSYINLIQLDQNSGKGVAIRKGLEKAAHEKIVIFDGDMELDPAEISKLMILDKDSGVVCVFGSRYETIKPFASLWDFGNFFFTGLFNTVHGSEMSDALCCAKAFFKNYIDLEKISARGFDIDVELAAMLSRKITSIEVVYLTYVRRSLHEGKKLRFNDGLKILKRILKS